MTNRDETTERALPEKIGKSIKWFFSIACIVLASGIIRAWIIKYVSAPSISPRAKIGVIVPAPAPIVLPTPVPDVRNGKTIHVDLSDSPRAVRVQEDSCFFPDWSFAERNCSWYAEVEFLSNSGVVAERQLFSPCKRVDLDHRREHNYFQVSGVGRFTIMSRPVSELGKQCGWDLLHLDLIR